MKNKAFTLLIFGISLLSCQENPLTIIESQAPMKNNEQNEPILESSVSVSKEEALKIIEPVTSKYADRWVDISKYVIPANSRIEYSPFGNMAEESKRVAVSSPDFDAWLAVIGPDVSINGSQSLIHIFVNANTGAYSVTQLDGKAIVEWDTSRYVYINDNTLRSSLRIKERPNTRSSEPTQWAVIISGGISPECNYSRYWNDCKYIYTTLTQKLDYPANHIFCLISDGIDPAYDRRTGSSTFDSSPIDFDNDGERDVDYSAIKHDISAVFSYLGSVVSDNDEVLVFITDHGDKEGIICLWNNETLTPSELDAELDKLGTKVNIDVVMGQCYSGAAIPALRADNRTIVTACNASQVSYGIDSYDYFLKYWTDGLNNINPDIVGQFSNGDGYISAYELFLKANSNPKALSNIETPQCSSSSMLVVWGHDLCGNMFIPYITGVEHLSNNYSDDCYLHNLPSSITPSWTCDNDLRIISSNSSSAKVAGNLPSTKYVSLDASVYVNFNDLGRTWTVSTSIPFTWRPGPFIGQGHIVGSNGYYFLAHYPLVGIYPGTSGYQWSSENQSCTITEQNGMTVRAFVNPSYSYGELSVIFTDPFNEMIYVSDQIQQ